MKCDFTAPLTKKGSPFFHLLDFGWPCDLLWPMEYNRSNAVPIPHRSLESCGRFLSPRIPLRPCEKPRLAYWMMTDIQLTQFPMLLTRDQQTFSVKGQIIESLGAILICHILFFDLLFYNSSKNINTISSLGTIQNQGPQISNSCLTWGPTNPPRRTV